MAPGARPKPRDPGFRDTKWSALRPGRHGEDADWRQPGRGRCRRHVTSQRRQRRCGLAAQAAAVLTSRNHIRDFKMDGSLEDDNPWRDHQNAGDGCGLVLRITRIRSYLPSGFRASLQVHCTNSFRFMVWSRLLRQEIPLSPIREAFSFRILAQYLSRLPFYRGMPQLRPLPVSSTHTHLWPWMWAWPKPMRSRLGVRIGMRW